MKFSKFNKTYLMILLLSILIIKLGYMVMKLCYSNTPIESFKNKIFSLHSNSFVNGGVLPNKFTCAGEGLSPDLYWVNVPEGTLSLALVMENPNNRFGNFAQWVVWNLKPNSNLKINDKSFLIGLNDDNRQEYKPPCAQKRNEYIFTLYALNIPSIPTLKSRETYRENLMEVVNNHKIGETQMSVYSGKI